MITDTNKNTLAQPAQYQPTAATSRLFTIKQFALAYPAFTESSLRNLIFKADTRHSSMGEIAGNGLLECGAIIRLGRRILIDDLAFMAWVRGNADTGGRGKVVGMSLD